MGYEEREVPRMMPKFGYNELEGRRERKKEGMEGGWEEGRKERKIEGRKEGWKRKEKWLVHLLNDDLYFYTRYRKGACFSGICSLKCYIEFGHSQSRAQENTQLEYRF